MAQKTKVNSARGQGPYNSAEPSQIIRVSSGKKKGRVGGWGGGACMEGIGLKAEVCLEPSNYRENSSHSQINRFNYIFWISSVKVSRG